MFQSVMNSSENGSAVRWVVYYNQLRGADDAMTALCNGRGSSHRGSSPLLLLHSLNDCKVHSVVYNEQENNVCPNVDFLTKEIVIPSLSFIVRSEPHAAIKHPEYYIN